MRRRADLETLLEELKARKESTPPDQYDTDLEKLLVEIARISPRSAPSHRGQISIFSRPASQVRKSRSDP